MATDSPDNKYLETYALYEPFFSQADFSAYGWSPPREYPPLTEIIQQDTSARAVYFIEYGLVKLSRMESSGREVIAGLRRSNWIIAAPSVLLGKKYSFTATALVDCKIRHISSKRFLSLIETNKDFSSHILRMFSHEIFNYGKTFSNLACLPAIDRLKRLLYDIMMEIKQPLGMEDKVKLIFPLKHKELAQMIAVAPEHLSRLLKQLERDGIIKREKGLIVLNNSRSLTQECGSQ